MKMRQGLEGLSRKEEHCQGAKGIQRIILQRLKGRILWIKGLFPHWQKSPDLVQTGQTFETIA